MFLLNKGMNSGNQEPILPLAFATGLKNKDDSHIMYV